MKKAILILLVLATLLIIAGCGQKPQNVADQFLTAMEKNDVETMKALSLEESHKTIEFIGMIQNDSKIISSHKIISTEIVDDVATVKYTVELTEEFKEETHQDEAPQEETLTLVKVDGTWKVKIDKDGMQK